MNVEQMIDCLNSTAELVNGTIIYDADHQSLETTKSVELANDLQKIAVYIEGIKLEMESLDEAKRFISTWLLMLDIDGLSESNKEGLLVFLSIINLAMRKLAWNMGLVNNERE